MRSSVTQVILFFIFCAALCVALPSRAAVSGLNLLSGKPMDVKPGAKGMVVVFLSAKCPCSNAHVSVIKNLATKFPDFSFVVVHSNSDEPLDMSKAYFQAAALPFPIIQDDKSKIADEFKAFKTPHAFIVGANGKVLYQGGVTSSASGDGDKQYLRDALVEINAGKTVKVAEGRTLGCVIAR